MRQQRRWADHCGAISLVLSALARIISQAVGPAILLFISLQALSSASRQHRPFPAQALPSTLISLTVPPLLLSGSWRYRLQPQATGQRDATGRPATARRGGPSAPATRGRPPITLVALRHHTCFHSLPERVCGPMRPG